MANIHFGLSNVWKATPAFIGRFQKAFNLTALSMAAFNGFLADKLHTTPTDFTQWIGVVGVGINFICMMFGVPIIGPTVPSQDVTEVETHSGKQ